MTISSEVFGRWTRFERYQIVDHRVVPASTTRIEYDPWELFRRNEGKYRTVSQPYLEFFELGKLLAARGGEDAQNLRALTESLSASTLDEVSREALLNWCNRYGLLGMLLAECDSLIAGEGQAHFRVGGSWATTDAPTERDLITVPLKPGIRWFDSLSGGEKVKAHRAFLARLLPFDQNSRGGPPRPLTDEFWAWYGEPIVDIAGIALIFYFAVDAMSRWQGDHSQNTGEIFWAYRVLRDWAEAVVSTFEFNSARNRFSPIRVSPSLMNSFALMVLLDRVEERRVIECANCCSVFVSDEKRARYCSPECRNRLHVRKSTEKRKNKAAFAAE